MWSLGEEGENRDFVVFGCVGIGRNASNEMGNFGASRLLCEETWKEPLLWQENLGNCHQSPGCQLNTET